MPAKQPVLIGNRLEISCPVSANVRTVINQRSRFVPQSSNFYLIIIPRADLGDAAKRRFQAFAASWSDPNRSSPQRTSSGNERRGLLSGNADLDMEEEMNFVGSSNNDAVELRDVGGSGGVDWSGDKKKD